MGTVRVSFVMSYASKMGITCTEVTSSYEEIGYYDDEDDSNNYSIELLFSNVLTPTAKCPFRETAQHTSTSKNTSDRTHEKTK